MKQEESIKNLNEDFKKYRNMSNLADKLVELSAGERALNSEDGDVIEFLNDKVSVESLKQKLENPLRAEKQLAYIRSSDKVRDTMLFMMKIKREKEKLRMRRLQRLATVAAVLVLSFVVFYFVTADKAVSVVSCEMKHSNTVPEIILDDGQRIGIQREVSKTVIESENISMLTENRVKYKSEEKDVLQSKYNQIVVPSKYTFSIELADGTEVHLNANSSLKFPVEFTGEERKVELVGEAYFNVAKSNKPFVVSVDGCSVTVYGTEFNINSNKRNVVETILVEGVVGFKSEKNEEIILRPNQLLSLNKESRNVHLVTVDVEKYLGWRKGCFFLEQEKLIVLLNEISHWYGIDFILTNKSIQNIVVSVNLDRNMALADLLRIMEEMFNIQIINEGNGKYSII